MDSLNDLLSSKNFDEPSEITAIKRYVQSTYHSGVQVQTSDQTLTVVVPSAALAAQLRMNLPALQKAAQTDKRIILRIGG